MAVEQSAKALQNAAALLFGAAGLFCAAATLLEYFASGRYFDRPTPNRRTAKSPAALNPSALRLRF